VKDCVEIRWHGRGGQGSKTAAMLLAEAASQAGRYVQGFPEYGPERMGAPVVAFNRLSERPITIHCNVQNPQIVVVLDPSLLKSANVTSGLGEDGIIIVNTERSPEAIKEELGLTTQRVYTIDANAISIETIGRPIPNTPMIGALVRASQLFDFSEFLGVTQAELEKKFKSKPGVVEGNVRAIERAYQEVKSA